MAAVDRHACDEFLLTSDTHSLGVYKLGGLALGSVHTMFGVGQHTTATATSVVPCVCTDTATFANARPASLQPFNRLPRRLHPPGRRGQVGGAG